MTAFLKAGKKFLETLRQYGDHSSPEKDNSDTQSAACLAMDRGMKQIMILGATGNRVDHLMANFGLLVLGRERGCEIHPADPWNYMKLIEGGTVLKRSEQFGKYVSFFSIGGTYPDLLLKALNIL